MQKKGRANYDGGCAAAAAAANSTALVLLLLIVYSRHPWIDQQQGEEEEGRWICARSHDGLVTGCRLSSAMVQSPKVQKSENDLYFVDNFPSFR